MSQPTHRTEFIQWKDAGGRIESVIAEIATAKKAAALHAGVNNVAANVVVGITGPVGAGKSTLAVRLSKCIISTDHYFPNYSETPEHLRDLPDQSDLPRLALDLAALRRGEAATIPQWSFVSHAREGYARVESARTIVCEGIHALHEIPRAQMDLCVYVQAPAALRWSRWEALEISGVRDLGVENARRFFHQFAEPIFYRFADEYKAAARFVVMNDEASS